jgi:hypothetical protein
MENNTPSEVGSGTSAKDFFLHLGSIVALYVVSGNFISLLFIIINKAYPEVSNYNYYFYSQGGSEISLPVATLIIVFPVFVLLSRWVHRTYEESPLKKHLSIRKWLTYITLFAAGVMLVGDLVTVLYKFLDGQDLTAAFLLKALTVLLVSGAVFGFYLQDIRDRVSQKARNIWAVAVGCLLLVAIILGFSVIGSPQTQRLVRQDNQKITDLQNLQWQVINYWQVNGMIPESMPNIPVDTQTGTPYKYQKMGEMRFQICAQFNREFAGGKYPGTMMEGPYFKGGMMQNDNWVHGMGWHCFDREIDPIAYPTQVRG